MMMMMIIIIITLLLLIILILFYKNKAYDVKRSIEIQSCSVGRLPSLLQSKQKTINDGVTAAVRCFSFFFYARPWSLFCFFLRSIAHQG